MQKLFRKYLLKIKIITLRRVFFKVFKYKYCTKYSKMYFEFLYLL